MTLKMREGASANLDHQEPCQEQAGAGRATAYRGADGRVYILHSADPRSLLE